MSQLHFTRTTTHWTDDLINMGTTLAKWASLPEKTEGSAEGISHWPAIESAIYKSCAENPWFTKESILQSLHGLAHLLRPDAIEQWAKQYNNLPKRYTAKQVGIVAAGNIPMVAFHDVLCTLIAGHKAEVKLSRQDRHLLPTVFKELESALDLTFELRWHEGQMSKTDAMVATGSNNSARYFEYYFGKLPHIIRRNRNAVAILRADEPDANLKALGDDIFRYFGLGCRNVAKLFVHEKFDMDRLFSAIYPFHEIVNHHKYANNYDYYKALWLMNGEKLLDNGFLLLRASDALASPPGVLYFERFTDEAKLRKKLEAQREQIQCIIAEGDVPFGKSQSPELWDYADGIDTMDFMLKL